MNIGQYLCRIKDQKMRADIRANIAEFNETKREIARLQAELDSKLPPPTSEVA